MFIGHYGAEFRSEEARLCCSVLDAGSKRGGLLIGAAVFWHWPLDLVVHRPGLPLSDNAASVGFGLWDYPPRDAGGRELSCTPAA